MQERSETIREAQDEALVFKLDTSDLTIACLVRLYYLHHADSMLTPAQAENINGALIGYKYALDEPGLSDAGVIPTQMWISRQSNFT